MAIFKRSRKDRETAGVTDGPAPRLIQAAAVPLTGPEAVRSLATRQTTEQWQNDAWYFYDAMGELSGPTDWISRAISKADIFGAEIDPETGLVTGPTQDVRAQRAAAMCLGGHGRRAQLQFILGVCWQIPGEAFVIIRGRTGKPDEWLVLSGRRVKAKSKTWTYQDPDTLNWVPLTGSDRMIRVWSPHPDDQSKANTAVRAALPVMREIEKASMNLAAVLDSRLATAGLHAIPSELDLPLSPGNTSTGEEVADMYLRAASAGIANPGTAAQHLPIIFPMPAEMIDPFVKGRMYPDTAMDSTVIELRDRDLSRLATSLDPPKAMAEGTQAEANHWGAWQVEEETYKSVIEPLLDRFGDALTEFWYRDVLAAMGVPNPELHVLAFDTTGIVTRPDSTEDANRLYDDLLISDDYRRAQSGIPDDAVPTDEETQIRFLRKAVEASPALLENPAVAEALGYPEIAAQAQETAQRESDAATAQLEAQRERNQTPEEGNRELPVGSTDPAPEAVTASAGGLLTACDLLVKDALQKAGARLLPRGRGKEYASTPLWEMHTVIRPDASDLGRLTAGAFVWLDDVAEMSGVRPDTLRMTLSTYVNGLLHSGRAHAREALRSTLDRSL